MPMASAKDPRTSAPASQNGTALPQPDDLPYRVLSFGRRFVLHVSELQRHTHDRRMPGAMRLLEGIRVQQEWGPPLRRTEESRHPGTRWRSTTRRVAVGCGMDSRDKGSALTMTGTVFTRCATVVL